jgi:protein-tyrosine phosphatase
MRILMVCLGNICRSPLAEGILRDKIKKNKLNIIVDSAGTSSWHQGEHPDKRAVQTAKNHSIDISFLTARQFTVQDFYEFDKIFAMDTTNYRDILSLAINEEQKQKVFLILNYNAPGADSVPDPYFGGDEGFENVFQMLDSACDKIISSICSAELK